MNTTICMGVGGQVSLVAFGALLGILFVLVVNRRMQNKRLKDMRKLVHKNFSNKGTVTGRTKRIHNFDIKRIRIER